VIVSELDCGSFAEMIPLYRAPVPSTSKIRRPIGGLHRNAFANLARFFVESVSLGFPLPVLGCFSAFYGPPPPQVLSFLRSDALRCVVCLLGALSVVYHPFCVTIFPLPLCFTAPSYPDHPGSSPPFVGNQNLLSLKSAHYGYDWTLGRELNLSLPNCSAC